MQIQQKLCFYAIPLNINSMARGKKNKYIQPAFWRRLLFFWTALSFVAVVADFLDIQAVKSSLTSILIIYVAVLSAYSSEKEFRRWHDHHEGRHPGELYVICWTLLLFGVLIADSFIGKEYVMPDAVVSTYIVTLGILALTKTSKALKRERK